MSLNRAVAIGAACEKEHQASAIASGDEIVAPNGAIVQVSENSCPAKGEHPTILQEEKQQILEMRNELLRNCSVGAGCDAG